METNRQLQFQEPNFVNFSTTLTGAEEYNPYSPTENPESLGSLIKNNFIIQFESSEPKELKKEDNNKTFYR